MQKYMKEVIFPNFGNYEFYIGESMNNDGMYVLISMLTTAVV